MQNSSKVKMFSCLAVSFLLMLSVLFMPAKANNTVHADITDLSNTTWQIKDQVLSYIALNASINFYSGENYGESFDSIHMGGGEAKRVNYRNGGEELNAGTAHGCVYYNVSSDVYELAEDYRCIYIVDGADADNSGSNFGALLNFLEANAIQIENPEFDPLGPSGGDPATGVAVNFIMPLVLVFATATLFVILAKKPRCQK